MSDKTKYITVTLEIEVPARATNQDISDWVDVQYGECNSMRSDNPCINEYEVISREWSYD